MKSRILLVYPFSKEKVLTGFPPLGIASIASYILNKDPEANVRVLDFTAEGFSLRKYEKELYDFKPEILGISVLTPNYSGGNQIAKITSALNPETLIIMGGVHATMRPQECLRSCNIVVRGEGEETLWEIIQDKELDTIKGISFWRDGEIVNNEERELIPDLNDLPLPAHALFRMRKYNAFPGWGVIGSRGCPYKCIFCLSPKTWGGSVRFRSPQNIVDEIQYLHSEYHIKKITFFDDTINIPKQRAIEICDELIKRNLHKEMSFECQMRANGQLVSPEVFQRMREANFTAVYFGIESGSDKVLRSIGKSLKAHEAMQAVKMAKKAGIKNVFGFFMIGQWDETISDVIKTWRFILSSRVLASCGVCIPFPGTDFYERLRQNGFIHEEPDWGNFYQAIPQVRTNKMSRADIFIMFISSFLIISILNLRMKHKPTATVSGIMHFVVSLIKMIVKKPFSRLASIK